MAERFISDEDIQRVRDASDIVAIIGERVPVRQRGRDFWCCCPLHNEKTPSLKIDPALQLWHCFGCGEGGDVFGFIMKTEDMTFPEAVRRLADRAHIDIAEVAARGGASSSRKARLKDVCRETAEFYHTQLMRNPASPAAEARAYLAARNMGGSIPKRWQLGFSPGSGSLVRHLSSKGFSSDDMVEANVAARGRDGRLRDRFFNRVMFPICDVQGECIAFGGRVVGLGEPKYLNSQETPIFHKSQVLYGLDKAKAGMASTGVAVVVEGYTDVIALHEAGIANVVATLGTALTMKHIRILARHAQKKIVYLFDGDAAGQRAADKALAFIDESMTPEAGRSRIELFAVTLPDNLDPAEFVEKHGAQALSDLIEHAEPLLKYGIERRLASHDLSRAEGRTRALSEALSILAPIKGSLIAKDYAVQIAHRVRAREEDVLDQLARLSLAPALRRDGAEPDASAEGATQGAVSGSVADCLHGDAPSLLPDAEVNRRRFERELLSVFAQYPLLALQHADALAQIQWHDSVHSALADSMLSTLADNPEASPATIVAHASQSVEGASGILTASTLVEAFSPEEVVGYLSEELSLGDIEDAIAALRQQLADPRGLSDQDYEMLFESVIGMQRDLTHRRLAHKPLVRDGDA